MLDPLGQVVRSDFDIATAGFAGLSDASSLMTQYHSTQLLFDLVALQAREMFSYGNYVLPALRSDGDRFAFAGSAKPWDVRVQGNLIEFGEHDSSQIDGNVTPNIRHTALVMSVAFYIEGALATP